MTWARHARTEDDHGRFAVLQAAYEVTLRNQNRRAARVVAGHCADVHDCAELLAMLGLELAVETDPATEPEMVSPRPDAESR